MITADREKREQAKREQAKRKNRASCGLPPPTAGRMAARGPQGTTRGVGS